MRRVDDVWLDIAADSLRNFYPVLDWATLGSQLADTLHMSVAGDFTWAPHVPGEVEADTARIDYDLPEVASRASDLHPLAAHYARTRTKQVLAIHQVPPPRTPASVAYMDELRTLGIEQHLWIPLPADGRGLHVCGGCRAHDQFTDDELAVAAQLQNLLSAMVTHAAIIERWRSRLGKDAATGPDAADEVHLSPRELSVLELCAEGMTAQQAARRLRISPRTVEKHLESVYRKLGVRERVSAVQRAQAIGLIGPAWTAPRAGSARGAG